MDEMTAKCEGKQVCECGSSEQEKQPGVDKLSRQGSRKRGCRAGKRKQQRIAEAAARARETEVELQALERVMAAIGGMSMTVGGESTTTAGVNGRRGGVHWDGRWHAQGVRSGSGFGSGSGSWSGSGGGGKWESQ